MPKSDTWPGGVGGSGGSGGGGGGDMAAGMDSAGSWDSVVSVNSGFSDDSMDHLSAEERACLMFLEETIDSLDTEEDSGLSNDEPDQPLPGNLNSKVAKLSASMNNNRLNGAQQHNSKKPFPNPLGDQKPPHSYLVPTPLLVANGTPHGTTHGHAAAPPPERKKSSASSRPQAAASDSQPVPPPWRSPPHVPSEVNVVVIPPPIKPKSYLGRRGESPPPRGPLSYDALVYLRRSASAKKSPLCPTVDHTIGGARPPPGPAAAAHQNHRNLARAPSSASAPEVLDRPRTGPPVAARKPSKAPPAAASAPSNGTAVPASPPADSSACRRFADPQKVRLEALQKLGLLKGDREPKTGPTPPTPAPSHPHSQPALDPASKREVRAPASSNPPRSPLSPHRQVQEVREPQGRPVQSSASFHHCPPRRGHNFLSDPSDAGAQHPEHRRTGAENHGPSLSRSVSMGVPSCGGDGHGHYHHRLVHGKMSEPVRRTATAAGTQPTPGGRPAAAGFSVVMLPGMGADRKEALRKLGLLKD